MQLFLLIFVVLAFLYFAVCCYIFYLNVFETDFTDRFPARAAYAVKDLPKVCVMFDCFYSDTVVTKGI